MTSAQHSNKTYFHYTPLVWIGRAIQVMGSIDTDPCTDDDAAFQPTKKRFTEGDPDSTQWRGNVFCNPPGIRGLPRKFFNHCVLHARTGGQVIYLAYNIEQLVWIQDFNRVSMDICIPRQRINFLNKKGDPQGSPTHGNAFIYMGPHGDRFRRVFPGFHLLNHNVPY